jgi:hypothetical protein
MTASRFDFSIFRPRAARPRNVTPVVTLDDAAFVTLIRPFRHSAHPFEGNEVEEVEELPLSPTQGNTWEGETMSNVSNSREGESKQLTRARVRVRA